MNTGDIGRISETAVIQRLLQKGVEVLLPWSSHLGYDVAYYVVEEYRNFGFFVHREARLVRIQVKTGRLTKDGSAIVFSTQQIHPSSRTGYQDSKRDYRRSDYRGKADYIAVYLPDNGKVYMIAVEECPKNTGIFHFKGHETGYNKGKRARWAEDYEI